MLTLIESGFASLGRDTLKSRIKETVASGRRAFLIVPEQQTVTREGEMSEFLPASAVLNFEVTNFTRFCDTVFREIGGLGEPSCDKARKALLMWKALSELSPLLNMTGKGITINSGLVNKSLEAVEKMQSLGISPSALADAQKSGIDNKRLKDKLNDISLIYSLYKRLLNEKYSDIDTDLLRLCERMKNKPTYMRDSVFFVDGFTSFTESQYALIALLTERSDLTVTLNLPKRERGNFQYAELLKTRSRLTNTANAVGKEVRVFKPDGRDTSYSPLIVECASLLFETEGEIDNESLQNEPEAIRIFEANTPFDECDFVAADIKRKVMAGASYSDFAIVSRSPDKYAGILSSSLKRADIPHFISEKRDSTCFEAVKLIFTLYSISVSNYSTEDVLTYAKCALSGLTREECDLFELYVTKWKLSGNSFSSGEDWNMNPRGYESFTEKDGEKLARVNEARRKILTPVIDFVEKSKECSTVKEHSELLYRFLSKINLEDSLIKKSEELKKCGEYAEALENEKLWKTICASLDTVVEIMGELTVSASTYLNLLDTVLSQVKIGRIPQHKDEVVFADALTARINKKKHVYLLGVNLGEFPRGASDNEYFTEREKAILCGAGLMIEPDIDLRYAKELYVFSGSFTTGTDSVTLTYSRRSSSFSAILPSDVIARIKTISNKKIVPTDLSKIPVKDRVYTPEMAMSILGEAEEKEYNEIKNALANYGMKDALAVSEGELQNTNLSLTEDALGLIYKGDVYLSQTRIDTFLKCPMSYFCGYTLGLDEGERAEINYALIGTFIHSVLENFFLELGKRGGDSSKLTEKDKEELAKDSSVDFVKEMLTDGRGSAREESTIRRLSRAAMPVIDSLCDEFCNCKFTPVFFELNLKNKHGISPGPAVFDTRDGGKVMLGGAIDRTDTYKDGEDVYVRVIDYKTGSKDFSPEDIKEGKNLQMFLYLKSIVESRDPEFLSAIGKGENGRLIPAGVIYVKTGISDTLIDLPDDALASKAAKEEQRRVGMLLDDEKSLSAMNPEYTPVTFDADGKVNKKSLKLLYNEEGWKQMLGTISEVVGDVGMRMKKGEACISQENLKGMNSPCRYCAYRPICRSGM